MNPRARALLVHACALLCLGLYGDAIAYELRGHAKLQASATELPSDSLLREFSDDPARDTGLDLRANLAGRRGAWNWQADYQLLLRDGDRVELQQRLPAAGFGRGVVPDDDFRIMDLTHRFTEQADRVGAHRLDRLVVGYSGRATVVKIGRQAISWGNGLVYNPVDFLNPFDPAAIDTEYKTGDDMLYGQYLLESGDDWQALWVGRRDADGDIERSVASQALKYHGFAGAHEFDLLLAGHFDDTVVAVGGLFDSGDALWRGDLMLTDTGDERFTSLVVNWSWSWVGWERNFSATLEYYHNGFGIDDGDYDPAALADNPELVERIARGELFTLARDYVAATTTIELTPLWLLTATGFVNLDDDSLLLQLVSRHDLAEDFQLLLAMNLPTGSEGSEFGGIDSAVDDRPLSTGISLFAQLAAYF